MFTKARLLSSLKPFQVALFLAIVLALFVSLHGQAQASNPLPPPPAPQLTAPADRANLTTLTPKLSWTAEPGATFYLLQVATDPIFSNMVFFTVVPTASYTVQLTDGLMYGTTYYWQVQAVGSSMDAGVWSLVGQFTVTVQQSPSDGAYATTQTPTFSWAAAPGAVWYEFYLSPTSSIDYTGTAIASGSTLTKYTPPSPLDYGPWYWGVCVTDSAGFRDCTINPWVVVVTQALPPAPTGLGLNVTSPTKDITPTFSWSGLASNVPGSPFTYGMQVDTVSSFAHPVAHESNSSSFKPGVGLDDGNYYWRVRAINAYGAVGKWSATGKFTIDTTPPPDPLLLSPYDESATTNTRPTFKWAKSAGAVSYELTVACKSTGESISLDKSGLTATSYSMSSKDTALLAGDLYQWWVIATDAAGNSSPGDDFSFLTVIAPPQPAAPAAPTLISPKNNTLTHTAPTLSWSVKGSGLESEIELSVVSSFEPVLDGWVTSSDQSSIPISLQSGTTYYWRVRADGPVEDSPWSPVWSFTYNTTQPAAPTLLSPPNFDLSSTGKPTFSWTAVPGAVGYLLGGWSNGMTMSTTSLITKSSYTPSTPLAYGEVIWYVQAVDAYGNKSADSVFGDFFIPLQNSPAPGAITSNPQPTFKWAAFPQSGVTYDLTVNGPGPTTITENNLVGTSYTPTAPLNPGQYTWQVTVNGVIHPAVAPYPTDQYYQLFINSPVPAAPGLLYPADKAALGPATVNNIILSNVAYASSYEVQVSPFSNFLPLPVNPFTFSADLSSTTTAWGMPLDNPTDPLPAAGGHQTYYWRVRGLSSSGAPGAWSAVRTFTYYAPPLAAPTLLSPANNGAVTNPQLALSWSSVPNAAGYYVWFASGSAPLDTDPPNIQLGNVTSYKLPVSIGEGLYYWTVEAYDPAGNTSTWITPRWFTILAGQTVLKTPTPTAEPTLTATTNEPAVVASPTPTPAAATIEPSPSPIPAEPTVEPSPSPTPTEPTVEPGPSSTPIEPTVEPSATPTPIDTAAP
ncbi:MAG TPA: hypothetical protein VKF38_04250 [Anaerolineaceae bacterium]|nr:hypothetical protein [Anaerolineaceae bacterium]